MSITSTVEYFYSLLSHPDTFDIARKQPNYFTRESKLGLPGLLKFVNVNIKFTKSVSLIFTSSGCYDHHPQSWISYPLFDMTFL